VKYCLTITERTPTPPERKDTHSIHVILDSLHEVAEQIENFELNWGVLVSMTITPWSE
jgi:hypothetical protein